MFGLFFFQTKIKWTRFLSDQMCCSVELQQGWNEGAAAWAQRGLGSVCGDDVLNKILFGCHE